MPKIRGSDVLCSISANRMALVCDLWLSFFQLFVVAFLPSFFFTVQLD